MTGRARFAFTGDVVLHGVEDYTEDPFKHVNSQLSRENLVVNLEATFHPGSGRYLATRSKICICQSEATVEYLNSLKPFLVNLSNNHIGDYGNNGAKFTFETLREKSIDYFGAGFESEAHNRFFVKKERILFVSYTLGTDRTSKRFYNEHDYIGPKKYSFAQYKADTKEHSKDVVVVLFHWGAQPSRFPYPYQRRIARELIDHGADLIIGNHAHVYQAYEQYKGKWVFYALGNFLLPNFKTTVSGTEFEVLATPEKRCSLVPVLDFSGAQVELCEIVRLRANSQFELQIEESRTDFFNAFLFDSDGVYRIFHQFYLVYRRVKVQFDKLLRPIYRAMDSRARLRWRSHSDEPTID